jgi:hypothetical protein
MFRIEDAEVREQPDWLIIAIFCVRVFTKIDVSLVLWNFINIVLGNIIFD